MKPRSTAAWAMVRARKLDHWAAQYAKFGPAGALRTADELREHVRALQPDYPGLEARRSDWEHHEAMRRLFDRAAHALVHYSRHRATG